MQEHRRALVTGGSGFIGTHLVSVLESRGYDVTNVDVRSPLDSSQHGLWKRVDVLDRDALLDVVQRSRPDAVVHLAARTDTEATEVAEYRVNTEGTANLLSAIGDTPSVARAIITSSQFVHRPGHLPEDDLDFEPHTAYGESKAIGEQLTREADLGAAWTIVRPTNIWGPWHPRYPFEFWEVLRKGLYVHPGRAPVIRSYGYVGNVVHQMAEILEAPAATVDRKVLYLGDEPIELLDWVQGFSRAITGRSARVVPRPALRLLALFGDALRLFGGRFPITSSRYRSMTESYPTPMKPTLQLLGEPPYSLQEGIDQTVEWLRSRGFFDGGLSR